MVVATAARRTVVATTLAGLSALDEGSSRGLDRTSYRLPGMAWLAWHSSRSRVTLTDLLTVSVGTPPGSTKSRVKVCG